MTDYKDDTLEAVGLSRRTLLASASAGAVATLAGSMPAQAAEPNAFETQTGNRI